MRLGKSTVNISTLLDKWTRDIQRSADLDRSALDQTIQWAQTGMYPVTLITLNAKYNDLRFAEIWR